MQKFFVLLSDQETGKVRWEYPNELNGNSKQEVFNLMKQDIPEETIYEILTEEEYLNKYYKNRNANGAKSQNAKEIIDTMSSENFENGKDFFNAMLKAGSDLDENSNENKKAESNIVSTKQKKQFSKKIDNIEDTQISESDIKYFEEGGIKFKLENGVLYKKVWKQVLLNGQKTPDGSEAVSEFRLVSSSTKKLISVDKVELQRLEWDKIETH